MPHPLTAPAVGFFGRLKHPTLLKITIGLMVLSWLLPDPIPFLDEIVSALGVMVLANWRKDPPPAPPAAEPSAHERPAIDGESRRE